MHCSANLQLVSHLLFNYFNTNHKLQNILQNNVSSESSYEVDVPDSSIPYPVSRYKPS